MNFIPFVLAIHGRIVNRMKTHTSLIILNSILFPFMPHPNYLSEEKKVNNDKGKYTTQSTNQGRPLKHKSVLFVLT